MMPNYVKCTWSVVPNVWKVGKVYPIEQLQGQGFRSPNRTFVPSTKIEWDAQENPHLPEPEYVKCLMSKFPGFTLGRMYSWPIKIDDDGRFRYICNIDVWKKEFIPVTKAQFEMQNFKISPCVRLIDIETDEIYVYGYDKIWRSTRNHALTRNIKTEEIGERFIPYTYTNPVVDRSKLKVSLASVESQEPASSKGVVDVRNLPCLSINDVAKIYKSAKEDSSYPTYTNRLEQMVKQKSNIK